MRRADLTGQKFWRLKAECFDHSDGKTTFWAFICECGTRKVLRANAVTCGIPPISVSQSRSSLSLPYIYNGIDRRNNSEGYTPENCCSCCWPCNKAKLAMGDSEFMHWIDRLAAHRAGHQAELLREARTLMPLGTARRADWLVRAAAK